MLAGEGAAERVAAFLLARVQTRRGRMWDGGPRPPGLAAAQLQPAPAPSGPALATLAQRRVRGVSEVVVRGLLAWDRAGRPVDVLDSIPRAHDVLARQARGRRCVSLIDDVTAAAHGDPRHQDGLSFVLHDIEHLEKFVAPDHHRGQVGFFRAVERTLHSPRFQALEVGFDAAWCADRDYVISDMNGSAVFLFAVLKMKVNMAARRQLALQEGGCLPTSGPLTAGEQAVARRATAILIDGFGLPESARAAAAAVSARRDDPAAARCLLAGFEALGSD